MIRRTGQISSQYAIANSTIAIRHYASNPKITDCLKKIWKGDAATVTNERGTYKVITRTPKEWDNQCDKNLKALIEQDLAKRNLKKKD